MGIAGNFLIQDAAYSMATAGTSRAFSKAFTLGFSSLVTNAEKGPHADLNPFVTMTPGNALERVARARGLTSVHVGGPWVLMAEAASSSSASGVTTDWEDRLLQADVEPIQGCTSSSPARRSGRIR
jgi:hypothetical protein